MQPSKVPLEEVERVLAAHEGWALQDGALVKVFSFTNFEKTMHFVNRVAALAEKTDHHPEMRITYRQCTLIYLTHEIEHISEKDLDAMEQIEAWEQT